MSDRTNRRCGTGFKVALCVTSLAIVGAFLCPAGNGAPVTNNLVVELTATNGITKDSSNKISIWADQFGGRDATNSASGSQPVFVADGGVRVKNMPFVRFNGASWLSWSNSAGVTMNGFDAFFVARLRSTTLANSGIMTLNDGVTFDWQTGNTACPWVAGFSGGLPTGAFMAYRGTFSGNYALPFDQWLIYEGIVTPGVSNVIRMRLGGQSSATLVGAYAETIGAGITPTQYALGARLLPAPSADYAVVDIAAVLLYKAPLSTSDRATVEQYLYDTYLPSSVAGCPVTSNLVMELTGGSGITKDGSDKVSLWADQALGDGNLDASQSASGNQPTYVADGGRNVRSKPYVAFNGSSWLVRSNFTGVTLNGFDAFFVARLHSTTAANGAIMTMNDGATLDWQAGNTAYPWIAGYSGGLPTGAALGYRGLLGSYYTLPFDQWLIYEGIATPGVSNVIRVWPRDQSAATEVGAYANSSGSGIIPTQYALGARLLPGPAAEHAIVDIAAVLLYKAPLSTDDRITVQQYLYNMYLKPSGTVMSFR